MKKGIATFTALFVTAGLTLGEGALTGLAAGTDMALVGLSSAVTTTAQTPEAQEEAAQEVKIEEIVAGTVLTGQAQEETAPADTTEVQVVEPVQEETYEVQEEAPAQEEAYDVQDETPAQEEAYDVQDEAPAQDEAYDVQDEAPVQEEVSYEVQVAEDSASEDEITEEAEEEIPEVLDTSMVGTTGFAQCSEYLNVRTDASTESDVSGKIYNNGSLEILDVLPGGWYQVRSGNVEGYVSADFVATGDEAEYIAADAGYTTAELGVEGLNVRADASTDAEVIGTATDDHQLEVVEDQGDWLKVLVDGEMYGYVSADYVSTTTEYATGETLEEEQARLDQEWLEYLAEQEAQRQAEEAAYLAAIAEQQAAYVDDTDYSAYTYTESYSAPAQETVSYSYSTDTSDLSAQCTNAYDAYLAAQEAADAAVANGEGEDAIISTAAAAQDAYAAYLSLQNQVDEAAWNAAYADTTYTDNGYTEDYSTTTADYTYTEDYSYDTYTEDYSYTEEAVEETAPAASSAGQAVANYATQFVGNPYVYGGSSLTGGADCSGFTMAVYSQFGVGLPHNAAAQSGCGTAVSLDSLQPGDLLFYEGGGGIGHVTMYIGNGQVVHASNPSNGIMISSMDYRTPVSARRFV